MVQDAGFFFARFRGMPWEYAAAFLDKRVSAVQGKYDVHFRRSRPSSEDVSPLTDLFYEACELLYWRWLLDRAPEPALQP